MPSLPPPWVATLRIRLFHARWVRNIFLAAISWKIFSRTVELTGFLALVSKSFTARRDSRTNQAAARSAARPRKSLAIAKWETAAQRRPALVEMCAMPSRRVNALEEMNAGSHTRLPRRVVMMERSKYGFYIALLCNILVHVNISVFWTLQPMPWGCCQLNNFAMPQHDSAPIWRNWFFNFSLERSEASLHLANTH